jgi:hypothetical protein
MNVDKICSDCGSVGKTVTRYSGSFFVEIILWLCFLAPGIIYSIWRLTTKRKVCRVCGGSMIPLNTPKGKMLSVQYGMSA